MSLLEDGVDILGLFGGSLIALSLVPQVWKAHKTQRAEDISYSYQCIYIVGTTFLNIYAFMLGLWPVYIPAVLEEVLIIILTIQKVIYTRRSAKHVMDRRRSSITQITTTKKTADSGRHSSIVPIDTAKEPKQLSSKILDEDEADVEKGSSSSE
jgi:uncharacterized protein with PQ loop repeat